MDRKVHEENRLSWNEATRAHNSHKGDQAKFLREGGSTLFPEELALLGDLRGRSLVHLQCNAGQDTLSLARRGASVLGVDISDEAIRFARELAQDSGIPAHFVRADVYDWLEETRALSRHYEVCFGSYGALCWLSDLRRWVRGIADVLAPGGRLVLMEFHPFAYTFNEKLVRDWPYFGNGQPLTEAKGVGDYVANAGEALVPWGYQEGVRGFQNPHRSHAFQWGIGELLTAVLQARLTLEAFEEYPYSNGCALFEGMRKLPGNRLALPSGVPNLPLMYGLVARKPGR